MLLSLRWFSQAFFAALSVCLTMRARRSWSFSRINRTLAGGRKRPVFSLLKLRQAALNDAVDEASHFLAAVFFVALHNHVHQPVGQVGVEHFQLRLRYAMQVLFPVGDAFTLGKADHSAQHVRADVLKDQHAAGLLLPLDHRIDGLDQRGHIKGIHQLERLQNASSRSSSMLSSSAKQSL